MLPITINVGPDTAADGANVQPRSGKTGELVITQLHGRYYEQAYRGNLFSAGNQAAQALSVALATTYTGLCLSNPLGNTKNLVLLKAAFALSVAPAAIASLHLIGGMSPTAQVTHTTPLVPQNNFLGGGSPTGKVDSAATIPTPVYLWALQNGFTAAALPNVPAPQMDFEGSIVIPPGGFVAIGALTAVTGFGSMMWEEVAV